MRIATAEETKVYLKGKYEASGLSSKTADTLAKKKSSQHAANAGGTSNRVVKRATGW